MKPAWHSVLFCPLVIFLNVLHSHCHETFKPALLVITFNGFRWDFISKFETPHFDKVLNEGVHARQGIKNVFPTSTLPNLWTLITGLYPESHGILRDVSLTQNGSAAFQSYFDSGTEPIWVTNQRQNNLAKSAVIMWSGTQYFVKWSKPIFIKYGDKDKSSKALIDQVVKWLTQEEPINLGLVYLDEPNFCHDSFSADSGKDIKNSLMIADDLIGYLLSSLRDQHLSNTVNIIITSDHGCTTVTSDHEIDLTNVIPNRERLVEKFIETSPQLSVIPTPGSEETLYQKLKQESDKQKSHFHVWRRMDIPERFHYKNSPQVTPIVALADLHFFFHTNSSRKKLERAKHYGYDNDLQDMHPIFLAMGPSFKKGYFVDSFNIVDVYPLMCHLLDLQPQPNNGSLTKVSGLLITHETTFWTFQTYILVLIFISGIGGVYVVAACQQHRYLKRQLSQREKSSFHMGMRYSASAKGTAVVRLLSYEEDDLDEEDQGFQNHSQKSMRIPH